MGYYTRYSLSVQRTENPSDIIEELREFSDGARYSFDEDGNNFDSTKWYEHENVMIEFSENTLNLFSF